MKVQTSEDPLIEIVIPNWNGMEMLSHCLGSIRQQTFTNYSVTVVDNGSTDGSLAMLSEKFPEVRVIPIDYNSGFSVAVNRGIVDSSAPWILLLNNDMEVPPACLEQLVSGFKKYKNYDYFALKMMSFSQRDIVDGAGDAFLRGGVGYRLGTLEKDNMKYSVSRQTYGACAGAALYSKGFFQKVGLFDEDFFAYLEDVDLNLRALRKGVRCVFLSDAIVYHIGSATSGSKINETTIRLSTRNNLAVIIKNYPAYFFLRFFCPIVIYQTMWLLFCLKKGMAMPYVKGLLQGVIRFPLYYRKRKNIQKDTGGISIKELGDILSSAEKEAVFSIMARREAAGKSNLLLEYYCKLFL